MKNPKAIRVRPVLSLGSAVCLCLSLSAFAYAESPKTAADPTPTLSPNHPTKSALSLPKPLTLAQQVQHFIQRYQHTLAQADAEALMQYYAPEVHYYSWGAVERDLVAEEKRAYFERWPIVKQTLLGEVDILDTEQPTEKIVSYLLHFSVENPEARTKDGAQGKRIQGHARHTWRLRHAGSQLKIIEEQQQVLDRLSVMD